MVKSVQKGKRGEDQFCKFLNKHFGINVRREHFQAQGKAADIILDDFLIEVKYREVHNFEDYWLQINTAKVRRGHDHQIPIVAYRSNRQPWRFMLPANLIHGIRKGYVIASEDVFIEFAKGIIRPKLGIEEGERCNDDFCTGVLYLTQEPCQCSTTPMPPCWACENYYLKCPRCEREIRS